MKFWEVTWGQLAPGDEIKAPDGTIWTVGSAITCDGSGEWEITNAQLKAHLWTMQKEKDKVLARRPSQPAIPPARIAAAKKLLADVLGAEVIS